MTRESRVALPWITAAVAAVAMLLIGAGSTYLLMRTDAHSPAVPAAAPVSEAPVSTGASPLADVEIPLGEEAAKRAGIVVTPVATAASSSTIRLPGVVTPNAYRQVTVTPLVSGRVTAVSVQLGDRVRRGQTIARIYSPELAEAQTRYVSAAAMLQAHDRELQRTQKLVEIGAASRQELEKIHAEHAAQIATVQSARAQLELLGVPSSRLDEAGARTLDATTDVPAPIDGVVTERSANAGLNVDPATKLFTIVDLSTVWVVADVHERDMSLVRVGTEASITSEAFAENVRRGRVSYIDPQVAPETRTAKARIELPNPSGELRLGLYVDVIVTPRDAASAQSGSTPMVPRGAIQNIGDRTVVYLADAAAPGRFIEREVRLGASSGELVEATSGIHAGDLVVTSGSFSLRAERERLGLRPPVR